MTPLSHRAFAAGLLLSTTLPTSALAQTTALTSNLEDTIIVTVTPLKKSVDEAITGVSSTFFGAGASRPIIRGQGGDRVRVLNNGVGSIDASSSSPDHAVAAEPAQAERIEVLRGASLLL